MAVFVYTGAMSADIQTALHTVSELSYFGVFGLSLIASVFVPVPEEIFLLALGYLTAAGFFHPVLITLIVIVGFAISDSGLYFLAQRQNKWLIRSRNKIMKRLGIKDGKLMKRHANKVIFFSRFLVQFRFLGPVLAGSYKIPYKRFLTVNLIALSVYVPLIILLGDYFQSRIERVLDGIGVARNLVFVGIAVVVAILLFRFMRTIFIKHFKTLGEEVMEMFGFTKEDE